MTRTIGSIGRMVVAASAVLLALTSAVLTPGAAAADPGEATHIDDLTAVVDAGRVIVGGQARFVDTPVLIGKSPRGLTLGREILPLGDDLTTATIARPDPFADEVTFTIGVANQPPDLGGTPEVIRYTWPLAVDGHSSEPELWLEAFRSNQTAQPGLEPVFRVVRLKWLKAPPPDGGQFVVQEVEVVGKVSGTMADGVVQWQVPMAMLGVEPGSRIDKLNKYDGQIEVYIGVSGPGLFRVLPPFRWDKIDLERAYTVPGPVVRVGVAPAGTPPQDVELTSVATVEEGGAFTADLPAPAVPGDYTVVAEACYGDCARSAVPVTV